MLCPAEEQAETIDKLGPLKPYLIATVPEAMLIIEPGTKKGEILFGPFSFNTREFFSIVSNPPMPEPMETPILSKSCSSKLIPESLIASAVAANPNWIKGSSLRESLGSIFSFLSKSLTVAPNFVANSDVSNL